MYHHPIKVGMPAHDTHDRNDCETIVSAEQRTPVVLFGYNGFSPAAQRERALSSARRGWV